MCQSSFREYSNIKRDDRDYKAGVNMTPSSKFDIASLKSRLLPADSILPIEGLGPPVAAVAIVINPKERDGTVLLIKRMERVGDPWSGQVAFPGGHIGRGDRTLSETAIREAREEVGIELRKHKMLGVLPVLHARSGRAVVTPFVFELSRNVRVRLNEEVAESFWAPLVELGELQVSKSEVQVEEENITVDSYIYRGRIIWGITFRIINMLLNRTHRSSLQ